eukprot:1139751-Pelagomonas_calceolata.AAC.1
MSGEALASTIHMTPLMSYQQARLCNRSHEATASTQCTHEHSCPSILRVLHACAHMQQAWEVI